MVRVYAGQHPIQLSYREETIEKHADNSINVKEMDGTSHRRLGTSRIARILIPRSS
jgi:hypothetical protein